MDDTPDPIEFELAPTEFRIECPNISMKFSEPAHLQLLAFTPTVRLESDAEQLVRELEAEKLGLQRQIERGVTAVRDLELSYDRSDRDSELTMVRNQELDAVIRWADDNLSCAPTAE
jgi:hypothetical protein